MKEIIEGDLNLIDQLCSWKIDEAEFRKNTSFTADIEQLRYLLYQTRDKVDSENNNQGFRSIFWELPKALTREEEINLYKEFLLMEWHHEHEEIIAAFQTRYNDDLENIDVLLQTIYTPPAYLKDESRYSYIRKCIYAIGALPQPHSVEALKKLGKSADSKITEMANHQIEKIDLKQSIRKETNS